MNFSTFTVLNKIETMINICNSDINKILNCSELINELHCIFSTKFEMPMRHHHFYSPIKDVHNALLLMPAWTNDYMGVKQLIVAPQNKNVPSIHSLYTLFDAVTGEILATMDASILTSARTACTSALAADFLARKDAESLLIVGTGKVAKYLVQAYTSIRSFKKISVWGRNREKVYQFKTELEDIGYQIEIVSELEDAVKKADIISVATLSETPIISGKWLKPGQHVDLIGSFKPTTREADDEVITKSSIFVDSEHALYESGDLVIPLDNEIITRNDIKGDIIELCSHQKKGRTTRGEITLFKSVGLAIEDLAAALLIYSKLK